MLTRERVARELEQMAWAGEVLADRLRDFMARRYGNPDAAPRALRLLLEEYGTSADGADVEAVHAELAAELALVEWIGRAPRAEVAGMAQAYATLARSLAGSPLTAPALRETLGGVVDLLELFVSPRNHAAGWEPGEILRGLSIGGGAPEPWGTMSAAELELAEHDAGWLRNRAGYAGPAHPVPHGVRPFVVPARSRFGGHDPAEVYAGEFLAITVHQDGGREGLDAEAATRTAEALARVGGHLFRLVAEVRQLRADAAVDERSRLAAEAAAELVEHLGTIGGALELRRRDDKWTEVEAEVYELEKALGLMCPSFPGITDPTAVLVERLRLVRAGLAQAGRERDAANRRAALAEKELQNPGARAVALAAEENARALAGAPAPVQLGSGAP